MNVEKRDHSKYYIRQGTAALKNLGWQPDGTVFIAMQIANFYFQRRGPNSLLTF